MLGNVRCRRRVFGEHGTATAVAVDQVAALAPCRADRGIDFVSSARPASKLLADAGSAAARQHETAGLAERSHQAAHGGMIALVASNHRRSKFDEDLDVHRRQDVSCTSRNLIGAAGKRARQNVVDVVATRRRPIGSPPLCHIALQNVAEVFRSAPVKSTLRAGAPIRPPR